MLKLSYSKRLLAIAHLLFKRSIIKKFFDQIDMTQQHTAAAVTLQSQGIQSITKTKKQSVKFTRCGQLDYSFNSPFCIFSL